MVAFLCLLVGILNRNVLHCVDNGPHNILPKMCWRISRATSISITVLRDLMCLD
ncbi:hypothetical protein PF005_g404 [Phytophthora fragariae]|uniref:Uncharacterized protein n=1 Tax=Phytophthora fragariae TaxID=53985 RepID=A0A6A3ZP22_9STRA|nr:hypothetical protein PF003_g9816 [Phytophthora fragariae]KAE8950114.1 hypothetical protein PF009_g356 [Phytophthora fragariae]KAE8990133.1 hypothetical protein PF011_g18477 [Phytophthora fragariae]KAE9113992.1 hypothetical protein PF007_g10549 [Phytophthora fragariae]KAE9139986.1 hypothetical protein PF010_g345 [Phytophthora fragariae]